MPLGSFHHTCFLSLTTTILFGKRAAAAAHGLLARPTINFLTKQVNSPARSALLLIRRNVYPTFCAHFTHACKYTTVDSINDNEFVGHSSSDWKHDYTYARHRAGIMISNKLKTYTGTYYLPRRKLIHAPTPLQSGHRGLRFYSIPSS